MSGSQILKGCIASLIEIDSQRWAFDEEVLSHSDGVLGKRNEIPDTLTT